MPDVFFANPHQAGKGRGTGYMAYTKTAVTRDTFKPVAF